MARASSVTGISGPGSAENQGMKGPGNGRNQYAPLVSPHVISANTVTLAAGTATITLPAPYLGDHSKYLVFVTVRGAATAVSVSAKTNDASGNFNSFTITGTGTQVVDWMIVNRGVGI
jgi:hypothetical protein